MCGLLFILRKDQRYHVDFDRALSTIKHRGPDATRSECIDHKWYLGHQRLKVVDLKERSDQPMWDAQRRFTILFNGEIYNYKTLATQYHLKTRTSSDTEVLLLLYQKLGANMLHELNGMFAILIFDRQTNDLFVARDRLGVKPLYRYEDPHWLIYASEIPPILSVVGQLPVSSEGMRQYRVLRTFFNGVTAYQGVEMFPAGHFTINERRQRYWSFPQGEQPPPSDEELRFLIQDAVSIRTLADVPVGSFLSGGLDSTIIATLSGKPDTWTVGFPDMNEFEWARIAADHIGSNHTAIEIDATAFFTALNTLTRLRREPLSVPNEVSIYLLSRAIKRKNTVALSGEGADELFFGYDRIFRWAIASKAFNLPEFADRYAYAAPQRDLEIIDSVIAPFRNHGSPVASVAAFFQVAHLHGLLRRLDASTMAASLEARPPFCDYRLVERMAGVPATYRIEGTEVKRPLKRIFRNMLPQAIVNRPKVGFPLPLERLFPSPTNEPGTARWLRYCEQQFLNCGELT